MFKKLSIAMFLFVMPIILLADDVIPMDDVFKDISSLVTNWKAMGTIGLVSAIIMLIVKIMKTSIVGGWFEAKSPLWKRAIIVILGVVSGIVLQVIGGAGWMSSLITGLISSGGAIAIYEVLKPMFSKPAA